MFVVIFTLYFEVQIQVIKNNHGFGVLMDYRYRCVYD